MEPIKLLVTRASARGRIFNGMLDGVNCDVKGMRLRYAFVCTYSFIYLFIESDQEREHIELCLLQYTRVTYKWDLRSHVNISVILSCVCFNLIIAFQTYSAA